MTRSLPALRVDHVLWVLGAVLAALALWPFLPAREPAPLRPAAATAAPPWLPALAPPSGFAAIAERPLFSPSRRPPAAEKVGATPSAGLETRYRLLGVMISGHEQRALVLDGARRLELGVGDRLETYAVSRIEQNRLVLTSPAGEAELPLRPAADPPKTPR